MMVKLGPLDSKNSCTGVRRVFNRLITHFCLVVWVDTEMVAADVGMGSGGASTGALTDEAGFDGTGEVRLLLKLLVLM